MSRIYTREAATVFLAACFRCSEANQPVAGWDKRTKGYVPLDTQEQIKEYLSQFPRADQRLGIAN